MEVGESTGMEAEDEFDWNIPKGISDRRIGAYIRWGRSSGEGTLENHTVKNHTLPNKSTTALSVSRDLSRDA